MLFDLPDPDQLYRALVARDDTYEGRAYVGVKTTGIFCRFTCPARKPKPENCSYFPSIGAALEAGFRPCKRCTPLIAASGADADVQRLLAALEARPQHRWREGDIANMGLDLSTVRRSFKRYFGMTFLEMARQHRLREGFETLREGGRVIDAQHDAGFASPAAFRTAFAALLGEPPGAFARDGLLRADWIETALGAMIAVSDARSLHLLEFTTRKALPTELKRLMKAAKGSLGFGRFAPTDQVERELAAFFKGTSPLFETPMTFHGTDFTRSVWSALCQIPAGETRSYSALAQDMGQPSATRAVARANGANQIAILVPCHRVLGADGALTGYGGGLWRKQRLLEIEAQYRS